MLFYFAIYSVFKSSILRSCYVTSDPVALKHPSFPASQLFAGRSKCHRFEEAHLARTALKFKNFLENKSPSHAPPIPASAGFLASKIAVWGTWLDQQRPIKQKKIFRPGHTASSGSQTQRDVPTHCLAPSLMLKDRLQFEVDRKQNNTQNKVSNIVIL